MLEKSLLWEFFNPENPKIRSSIFGTMHRTSSDSGIFLKKLEPEVKSYGRVFTETSLAAEEIDRLRGHLSNIRIDWSEYLSDKKRLKLSKIFDKAYGLNLSVYQTTRPMFAIAEIIHRIVGADRSVSPDQIIWDWAVMEGAEVGGLEHAFEQIAVLEAIPVRYDFDQMIRIGRQVNRFTRHVRKLLFAYADQDLALLYHKARMSLGKSRRPLLYDRNVRMADKIILNHQKGPCFFSMGAGHLAGRFGILRIIKNAGYQLNAKRIEV